jgi:tRNA pseudouridine55 synthase
VKLAARPVRIETFTVDEVRRARDEGLAVVDLDVTVVCSSGTYIRALARDLGSGLGVGGHLTALRRTRVGGYGLDVASTLDELEPEADRAVLPLAAAARATFPARELAPEEVTEIAFGRRVVALPDGPAGTTALPVAAFAPDGALVALLVDDGVGRSRPVLVVVPA